MGEPVRRLRNIAIIAHVDHGKTTLVDQLLRQSGTLHAHGETVERVMDSNELERERGITILAKNTAITWRDWRINIVDTPGHADFGGEVERVLSMVDSVLLLVDAVEGPMPQTTFVTRKALARGLRPIVVVNKVDRPIARPEWVVDQTFDLFDRLGASDGQLDFPVVFASATEGWASLDSHVRSGDMTPLLTTIVDHVPPPAADADGPFQLQVSSLNYSSYVGVIGIGRIRRGRIRRNSAVAIAAVDGSVRRGRMLQILGFQGLERIEREEASAGDIIAFTGIDGIKISETICDPEAVEPLDPLVVDEPTVSMTFQVNDSPLGGREGKFVTSRTLRDRLDQELLHNVALRVEPGETPDKFKVSGRGELHLAILIETMRREGYELCVSQPQVITQTGPKGELLEPYEHAVIDLEDKYTGPVVEELGRRLGQMKEMRPSGPGRVRLEYRIPSRGLIGYRSQFLTDTRGTGVLYTQLDDYDVWAGAVRSRVNGVLIANEVGETNAYALFSLQDRGVMFVGPGVNVYGGMIVGIHSRDNDLVVNPNKTKKLTNIRSAGADEKLILAPPRAITLEYALEFINDDELVEVTPQSIRLRKSVLDHNVRKRFEKAAEAGLPDDD